MPYFTPFLTAPLASCAHIGLKSVAIVTVPPPTKAAERPIRVAFILWVNHSIADLVKASTALSVSLV